MIGLWPQSAMNIGEILIWQSSNLLLLIPVVIGLVMLVRCCRLYHTVRVTIGQLGVEG